MDTQCSITTNPAQPTLAQGNTSIPPSQIPPTLRTVPTGESPHSEKTWAAIRPIYVRLRNPDNSRHIAGTDGVKRERTWGCSIRQALMILRLLYNFKTTESALKQKKPVSEWSPDITRGRNLPEGTRDAYGPEPSYVDIPIKGSTPARVMPALCYLQTDLLLGIHKYVHRYYLSAERKAHSSYMRQQAVRNWQNLLVRWRHVETLLRKQDDISVTRPNRLARGRELQAILTVNPKDRTKAQQSQLHEIEKILCENRQSDKQRLGHIIEEAFRRHILDYLNDIIGTSWPLTLMSFWLLCQRLHKFSSRFKEYCAVDNTNFLDDILQRMRDVLDNNANQHKHVHLSGVMRTFQRLLRVHNSEIEDTLRLSSLCTIRALSSNIPHDNTTLISSWVSHYETWGGITLDQQKILEYYERAISKSKNAEWDEATIENIRNYAVLLYYVFQDQCRAAELARQLWNRTWTLLQQPDVPTWDVKTEALAEAACLRALTVFVYHENMRKSRRELEVMRKGLKLRKKSRRRKWRAQQLVEQTSSPSVAEATATLNDLLVVSRYLGRMNGDFVGVLEAAKLREMHSVLLRRFGLREQVMLAMEHRGEASRGRKDITTELEAVDWDADHTMGGV